MFNRFKSIILRFFHSKKVEDEDQNFSFLSGDDLTFERKEELLDSIANKIVKFRLAPVAPLFLGSIKNYSFIGSNLFLLPMAPFLELFGLKGYQYVALFEKKENVERLLNKIKELESNTNK